MDLRSAHKVHTKRQLSCWANAHALHPPTIALLCICLASQDVWRNLQDQVQDSERDAQARKLRQGLGWLGACAAKDGTASA